MLGKAEIAGALREIGALLELDGENPFKVRAYENGARALEALHEDLATVLAEGRLEEVPGIGRALAEKITELHRAGRLPLLERLRAAHPPALLELLALPDLGPKKLAALQKALGIRSVAELEAACAAGKVRELKGFGEKTEQKLLDAIRRRRERPRRFLLSEASAIGERIVAHLRGSPAVIQCEVAGSTRRGRETVGDLDVVVASQQPGAVSAHFLALPGIGETLAHGETKTSVRLANGLQVDLRIVPPADFATLLHHLTGSKAHHVKLRGLARERGLTLSEWGLFELPRGPAPASAEEGPPAHGAKVLVRSEPELYRALGLAPIPPELREDEGEIEAARDGTLPDDLVRLEDVRGMVHCHTTWSDGHVGVEELARAAEAAGFEYLTVTDHSGAAAYAGGLDAERLRRQWDEIDEVQQRVGIRLLKGTEADILEDGALDWPDALLEGLDVVIASIHSRMKMAEDEMTRRLVRAMSLPIFKIWGHASGRLLGERDPYAVRMEEVLDALAASRGAIEVNGDPHRLDMEPRWLRRARARGIPFVLTTDAHRLEALGQLRWAVVTARRGWVTKGEVLNALPAGEFARAVKPAG
ncbi:MAG TPA: DNA polymerase/3'-5' exonuclease PolX [Anaeromyxobacteraceae bacterium]|nr:DNA polymerase/3'-5' exonuclease PolX [Anaeromyxobacteraceae bacterium]